MTFSLHIARPEDIIYFEGSSFFNRANTSFVFLSLNRFLLIE